MKLTTASQYSMDQAQVLATEISTDPGQIWGEKKVKKENKTKTPKPKAGIFETNLEEERDRIFHGILPTQTKLSAFLS